MSTSHREELLLSVTILGISGLKNSRVEFYSRKRIGGAALANWKLLSAPPITKVLLTLLRLLMLLYIFIFNSTCFNCSLIAMVFRLSALHGIFFFIEKNGLYVSVMQQCVSHTLLSIQTVFFSFNKPGFGKEPLNCLHCLLALLWQSYLDSNILFIVRLKEMIKKTFTCFWLLWNTLLSPCSITGSFYIDMLKKNTAKILGVFVPACLYPAFCLVIITLGKFAS